MHFRFHIGLCDDCINQTVGDMPPPTPDDLQGFWEMVYLQVENVDSLFVELDKIRANDWQVNSLCTNYIEINLRNLLVVIVIVVVFYIDNTNSVVVVIFSQIETDTRKTKATTRCKINETASISTKSERNGCRKKVRYSNCSR